MESLFTAVFQKTDKWWIAFVEELPGANAQGETIDEIWSKKWLWGGKGIEVLKKIGETIELSSEEKEAILKAIHSKRDEKRDFDDRLRYGHLDWDIR